MDKEILSCNKIPKFIRLIIPENRWYLCTEIEAYDSNISSRDAQ